MHKNVVTIVLALMALIGVAAIVFGLSIKDEKQVSIEEYVKPEVLEKVNEEYDVVVVGGEPEGVAAAIMAARTGSKVLLIEKREELGGLFTYGMLNFLDIPQGEDGKSVSQGIYKEWHALVGGDNAFGIEEAKAAFQTLVDQEKNITLLVNATVEEAIVEGNTVVGAKIKTATNTQTVKAKAFIDATQDADFAVMAGAPYFTGGQDIGIPDKKMAVTLMLHLKNVNWNGVRETAKSQKFGVAEVTSSVAWGFSDLHYSYKAIEENTRLRGLNLVKVGDDYYINALQIFGIDGLNEESKALAIEKGKRETDHILEYLRAEFPGFENAEVASYPTELYVRETRHVLAEYQLPMSDVWTNADHWDSIGFGAYPVDVQAQTVQDYGYVISDPKQYAIPFRTLVPLEIDGLLVVGRSTGYSSLAAGSARIVPTGMVTGDAAGVASSLAIKEGVTFREMSKDKALIETLRTNLEKQGALVKHRVTSYPYQGEWFDASIQTLINYGLVVGGYSNDLYVDKITTVHSLLNMLKGAVERPDSAVKDQYTEKLQAIYAAEYNKENKNLDLNTASAILAQLFLGEDAGENNWSNLIEARIISENTAANVDATNHELKSKEMFAISADVINYLLAQ